MKISWHGILLYLVIFSAVFIPPISSVPFSQKETPQVVYEVVTQLSGRYSWLNPITHIAMIIMIVFVLRDGKGYGRLLDAYFGILFIFFAFGNSMAETDSYGFVVLTSNLVIILIVGLYWLWEAYKPANQYTFDIYPLWRYWVIPPALLAFWFPLSPDLGPDFDPLLLLTSDFGTFFCPTTPVVIALLTLIYPRVNKRLLTVTSLVGLMIAIFNVLSLFTMPGYSLWLFFLHTPLLLVSFYGLIIPLLLRERREALNEDNKY